MLTMTQRLNPAKIYRLAACAILLTVAVLIVMTFRDYGITWDEELQSQYGLAVMDYYTSLFKDQRYGEIFNLYLYGGMFDGLASVVDHFTPFVIYETRHLVNAIFGLLGLWGTWRLTRLIKDDGAALIALIFLVLTPVFYGHMFNNPKDIPFAAGIIWTMYFMTRCMTAMPQPKVSLIVRLGIILGLTMGVRVGGVMVFGLWFAPLGLKVLEPLWNQRNMSGFGLSVARGWEYLRKLVLPAGIISYGIMLLCWPWAQQNPVMNPLRALKEFSNFPQKVEVLLDGTTYMSTELPWNYVPEYFSVQMPELVLALFVAGLVLLPWLFKRLETTGQRQGLLLVLLMGLFPTCFAMIRHPALYDAVRHFLFVTPIICIIAAITARDLFDWSRARVAQPALRMAVTGLMAAAMGFHIVAMTDIMERLHPYEYIYANGFTGGVAGAYGKYELDYWGMSFKEAAQRIQQYVAQNGGIPSGKIYRVAICGPWDAAMIYMPPDYEAVEADKPAEFFLSTTRWMCQNMRPGKEIIRIKRFGVPLSIVKDLRGGYEEIPK